MKKYKTGLVIGKFLPFHLGHENLIKMALAQTDDLTIIVCNTTEYNISPKLRKQWISNVFPNTHIKILEHDKRLDSSSTEISKEWAELTLSFLGFRPEVVFSSENYGKAYADYMKCDHILYDKERIKFPISATMIRENPYFHWNMLGEDVKAFYCKRVVILGAESTGTTTLAKDLAQYFNTVWVPEYGRTYYEGKMFSSNSIEWNTREFIHIAQQQNNIEDQMAKKSNMILICDTDSFTTGVWHERYIGKRSKKVEMLSKNRNYDLYILTGTDVPFEQDGTRDGEHIREWMHNTFIKRLTEYKKNFFIITGSRETRLNKAVTEINKLLGYRNTSCPVVSSTQLISK